MNKKDYQINKIKYHHQRLKNLGFTHDHIVEILSEPEKCKHTLDLFGGYA